ncbi:MAG: carbohydrate kinase family protein [Enterococcus sp.]|nr:carbohydrate kinase family protein [Enterococcus sp.]
MKNKIIVAGAICLDLTPVFPKNITGDTLKNTLRPGKLVKVDSLKFHTGGSVANTGLALKFLGEDVELIAKVGGDHLGQITVSELEKHDVSGLVIDKALDSSYTIILTVPGIDRAFLHNPGANNFFQSSDISENSLKDACLFHFGYPEVMQNIYKNNGEELFEIFKRVSDKGIATSLDLVQADPDSEAGKLNWELILSRVLPFVDFFVPSFEELCFSLEREKYDNLSALGGNMIEHIDFENDVIPLANKALEMGAKTVMIKCGTKGILLKTSKREVLTNIGNRISLDFDAWENKEIIQPCYKAKQVLSEAAAGDTSIATFLSAVLKRFSPEKCVSLAAAQGACAVTTYDALSGLKQLKDLEKIYSISA